MSWEHFYRILRNQNTFTIPSGLYHSQSTVAQWQMFGAYVLSHSVYLCLDCLIRPEFRLCIIQLLKHKMTAPDDNKWQIRIQQNTK